MHHNQLSLRLQSLLSEENLHNKFNVYVRSYLYIKYLLAEFDEIGFKDEAINIVNAVLEIACQRNVEHYLVWSEVLEDKVKLPPFFYSHIDIFTRGLEYYVEGNSEIDRDFSKEVYVKGITQARLAIADELNSCLALN